MKRSYLVLALIITAIFPAYLSSAQTSLTQGLVAFYTLGGNANDASGNGLNGIISTNCSFGTDQFGNTNNAISFNNILTLADSNSARVDIPAVALQSAVGTISAWINPSVIAYGAITAQQIDGLDSVAVFSIGGYPDMNGAIVQGTPGTLYFHSQNINLNAASTTAVVSNQWQLVTVVYSDTNCAFYIDGELAGTTNGSFTVPTLPYPTTTSIGSWYGSGDPTTNDYAEQRFVGLMDNVSIYNRNLSPTEILALYNNVTSTVPYVHTAKATAVITNGFLVGAIVTDPGYGYTSAPRVRLMGGGGSNAVMNAQVGGNVVTEVDAYSAGFGYTNPPVIVIDPPVINPPGIAISSQSVLDFTNLILGTNYQLQIYYGGKFTNEGSIFTATATSYTLAFDGLTTAGGYQLLPLPQPATATAVPIVINGFIVGATITSGGSGYTSAPTVSFIDGDGTNAAATATVSNGAVTKISMTSAGMGYTGGSTISLTAPPPVTIQPSGSRQLTLSLSVLVPYDNYQVLSSTGVAGGWRNFGAMFTANTNVLTETVPLTNSSAFFRLMHLP